MWMASILQVLALGAVDPPPPLAASAAPAPIYWRQTLFSIPFHVEHPDGVHPDPVEVQLHVSGDRGVTWDNYRRAPPQKGYSFSQRAPTANTGSMSARSTVPVRSARKARTHPN